jgi:RNA polymerase subunit RPABC4/transcription elongation factor Spt4
MAVLELKQLVCQNCGGKIDRATMKCPYCDTQYESKNEMVQIVLDRPGTYKIRCHAKIDRALMAKAPEMARDHVLRQMRSQIADELLGFMKFMTSEEYDPISMCQLIRGEITVLEPRGY